MRLVTWNCNGALRRKHALLDTLNADILVVQECEDPQRSTASYQAWAGEHAWIGYNKNKGLGIFPRREQTIERLIWPQENGGIFLPVNVGSDFTIVGVWTLGRKTADQFSYIAQFWHYLQLNRDRLGSKAVICGDFNSNQIWDANRRRRNHAECVQDLAEAGYHSLYHLSSGDVQGGETVPTFYLYRSVQRPYHIDYVFAHDDFLRGRAPAVQVGASSDWLHASDHMPLIVDLHEAD